MKKKNSIELTKTTRIVTFLFLILIGVLVICFFNDIQLPFNNIHIVILTCLILLSFTTLFLEHYFTKPSDILASTISIMLLIIPLKENLTQFNVWYDIYLGYIVIIFLLTFISMFLYSPEKQEETGLNRSSNFLKNIVIYLGQSKKLYFILFILTMIFYVDTKSTYFISLFLYSAFILTSPWNYINKIINSLKKDKKNKNNDIGTIYSVQSKNIFEIKIYENLTGINKFDFVYFKYSKEKRDKIYYGLVVENYLLKKEQWIKVLTIDDFKEVFQDDGNEFLKKDNIVYKVTNINENTHITNLIGIVCENSDIFKIKFIYNSKKEIFKGQLLEIKINGKIILYQVIEGITHSELIEERNRAGYVIGEAIQLGEWIKEKKYFDKYGWVPEMNSPVYISNNSDKIELKDDEFSIGKIPNTEFPVIMNLNEAISHHLGILGVTGSGKSVFSRNLIKNIIKNEFKVIIVDFTNEYKNKFSKEIIFNLSLNAGTNTKEIINKFLLSEKKITIFELSDITNSKDMLNKIEGFFNALFEISRNNNTNNPKLCVVLEEAHTIIPEINFLAKNDWDLKANAINISQIALQGRKYNIGFVVIAQRTANVSKTVLTQCNSFILFQEFDNTSKDFLSNYLGNDMVNALSNLKQRQAIAVGKAFKNTIPVIFEVPEIPEETIKVENVEINNNNDDDDIPF